MTDHAPESGLDRRQSLLVLAAGAVGAGIAAGPPAAAAPAPAGNGLEAAFLAAFTTAADRPGDTPRDRLGLLADPALVIEHDVPFPLDRAAYADHLAFHAANWERVETRLYEVKSVVHGGTGIVSAYFIERGKPKHAGFRLRAGYCTAVCSLEGGRWRAIALHLAPLSGQLTDASPG